MVRDGFQEYGSCFLRSGRRRWLGVGLTPSRAFSTEIFWSAMPFPMHPLTFSLKRLVLAAGHTTADQAVHTPERILPLSLCISEFKLPAAILTNGFTHAIFSNHFGDSVSLNELQKNEQCFAILSLRLYVVLRIFLVCKKRDGHICVTSIESCFPT